MDAIVERLTGPLLEPATAVLFRKALCLYVAVNIGIMLPVAEQLFGPDSYTLPLRDAGLLAMRGWNLLATPFIREYYWLFIAVLYVALALAFWGKWVRASLFVAWVLSVNLTLGALGITNGGYHLINLLLFAAFLIGKPQPNAPSTKWQVIDRLAAQLGFLGARVQVALLYAVAGLYKLFGADWQAGEAMYYILNVEAFRLPWMADMVDENGLLLQLATWLAMSYQLAFPVLVWFRKLRWPVLLAGTLMHLFIAVGMGLMDFGFAMLVAYVVFYPNSYAEKLLLRLGVQHS